MKHFSVLKGKEEKPEKNSTKIKGESVTDDSQYRPDIASIRDKAIAMNESGEARIGKYDSDNQKKIDQSILNSLAYARGMSRDITEITAAKEYLEKYLDKADVDMAKEEKEELEKQLNTELLAKIVENTDKNEKTEIRN